ncbi:MAG: PAS domain-containing sensor histidine kinase [Elusimicrobia bacterium]|nr:PAS domain-containing sensor histidine kinase [Elusimicrobiota bacterium]
MSGHPLPTKFLPAESAPTEEVRRQHEVLSSLPLVTGLLDAMPNMVMILNENRQIIYANKVTLDTLQVGLDAILGKRTGEAMDCIHAREEVGGCGTTEFCTACGAAGAVACALKGKPDAQECRIPVREPKPDLDLKVWATPFRHEGFAFTIFAAEDISHEKRRRILERIFFHDVMNTAGGVKGLSEILEGSGPAEASEIAKLLRLSSDQLVEEIRSQRDLASIENGEYKTAPTPIPLRPFLEVAARLCAAHETAKHRSIVVDPGVPAETIVTDPVLLMRVAGNMIKNALEAEGPGAVITVGCAKVEGGRYAVWVRNASVMPRKVQLQVFQRSFSTKGEGRGLGTYSIKLLSERFLKGKASFTSVEGRGTEFRVTLPPSIS